MVLNQATINDLAIRYTSYGQGPPALLVHGYAHAHTMWERPIHGYLKKHYRCYALDLPGHGASDKPPLEWFTLENFTETLSQFCLQLQLENILLIGYSMGGLIGMNLALTHPDLVANLVTINAPVKGDFLARWDPLLRFEGLVKRRFAEQLFELYTKTRLFALPTELRRYAQPQMIFSQSCHRVQVELARCRLQTLVGNYKVIRQADISRQIAHLHCPMLVITSDRDRVVPPEQAKRVYEQVDQAHLALITRCGHLPIDEQPDLFDKTLQEYLNINHTLDSTSH